MILSNQSILSYQAQSSMIVPFSSKKVVNHGMSSGLTHAGYDIRIAETIILYPVTLKNLVLNSLGITRPSFSLASTIEKFNVPANIMATVMDKSSWARKGLAIQNTCLEPGWTGFLTLELSNHGNSILTIPAGSPIAQLVFHMLDHATIVPYNGKYQSQEAGPQPARTEYPATIHTIKP